MKTKSYPRWPKVSTSSGLLIVIRAPTTRWPARSFALRLLARKGPPWAWSAGSGPGVVRDDEARDRVARGAGRELVAVEPAGVLELVLVDRDLAARVPGDEADHELAGERPVLAPDVLDVADVDAHLFLDFARDCPLERLAVVDEAGDQGVAAGRPARLPGEQDARSVADERDHRRVGVGVGLVAGAGGLLAPAAGGARGRLAASRAMAAGGLPPEQLHRHPAQ